MKTAQKFLTVVFCLAFSIARAQPGLCPPNIDFEDGDFTNWECRAGRVNVVDGLSSIFWNVFDKVIDRHVIIPSSDTDVDQYGQFPIKCPNGSGYSVKLGNSRSNFEAEGLFYTYAIPASVTKFSLIINYAVVLQDPGHNPEEQPRFRARIVNVTDGDVEIDCVNFDFTASGFMPGFETSPVAIDIRYKDWTPISIDLSAYIGKTIRLEFITSDCARGAHFGYAYVDVNSSCSGAIQGTVLCSGDGTLTLTAPYGFQEYAWYSDNTFSTVIGTNQVLVLDPAPTVGTSFPLIVTPYPTFGCVDTLIAEISTGENPVSDAGPDKQVCSKQPSLIGAAPLAGMGYSWSPDSLLSNAGSSAPLVLPYLSAPTDFIVKTTNLYTGCFSYDTVTVVPFIVDTSTSVSGKLAYCPGETFQTTLSANNAAASVQWYQNNAPITGANQQDFQPFPTKTASYWALLTENGCFDSTRQHIVTITAKPKASFKLDTEFQCISNPGIFMNKSTIADGTSLTYQWKFSDGFQSADVDLVKNFNTTGDVLAKLVAVSINGCKDSVQTMLKVMASCGAYVPNAFTPNNDGLNDIIKPMLAGQKAIKRFSIYNRHGNMVFSTTRLGEGWDGTYKGLQLDPAVFIWMLEYITTDDRTIVEKGTLTLIR